MASPFETNFFDCLNFSQDVKNTIISALVELGAEDIGDIQYITDKDLIDRGVKVIPARKLIIYFNKNFLKAPGLLRRNIDIVDSTQESLLLTCNSLQKNMHCLTNFVNNLREGIPRDSPSRMSRLNVLDIAQLSKADLVKKKEKVKKKKGTRSKARATTAPVTDCGKSKKRKEKDNKSDKKRKRGKSPTMSDRDSPKYPKFATQAIDSLELAPRSKGASLPTIHELSKLGKEAINSKDLPEMRKSVKDKSADEKPPSQNPSPITSPHISPKNSPKTSPKISPNPSPRLAAKATTTTQISGDEKLLHDMPPGSRVLKRTETETVVEINLSESESDSSEQDIGFEQCDQEFDQLAREINTLLENEEATVPVPEPSNSKYEQVIVCDDPVEENKGEANITTATIAEPKPTRNRAEAKEAGDSGGDILGADATGPGTAAETKEIVDSNKDTNNQCNVQIQSPKGFEGKKFKYELKQTLLDSEEDDESDDDLEEEDDESDEPRIIPSCSLMEYDVVMNDKKTPLEVIYSICKLSTQLNEMIGGAICPANSNIEPVGENQWLVKVKWALPMENFALPAAPDPNALALWILEVLPPAKPEEMAARRGVFVDLDWSIFSNLSKQAIAAHK